MKYLFHAVDDHQYILIFEILNRSNIIFIEMESIWVSSTQPQTLTLIKHCLLHCELRSKLRLHIRVISVPNLLEILDSILNLVFHRLSFRCVLCSVIFQVGKHHCDLFVQKFIFFGIVPYELGLEELNFVFNHPMYIIDFCDLFCRKLRDLLGLRNVFEDLLVFNFK